MTAYQTIILNTLIKWQNMSYDEAYEFVSKMKNFMNKYSIDAAIEGLCIYIPFDKEKLSNHVYKGFLIDTSVLANYSNDELYEIIYNVLSYIHDNWIKNNNSVSIYKNKLLNGKLRQFVPFELIGFNEVKSDLVFLEPIMNSLGVNIDISKLEKVYHYHMNDFIDTLGINNPDDLENYIYSNNFSNMLKSHHKEITSQIINNWEKEDYKSYLELLRNSCEEAFEKRDN